MKRYAEGTNVSVDSSRGEITGILAKHGVHTMAWGSNPTGDQLQFELEGHVYRFTIPKPTVDELRERDSGEYVYPHNVDWNAKAAMEWKRRWRANVLLLKAKLEFASGDASTALRELMPYALMKDGRTLEEAVLDGKMPLQLAAGG